MLWIFCKEVATWASKHWSLAEWANMNWTQKLPRNLTFYAFWLACSIMVSHSCVTWVPQATSRCPPCAAHISAVLHWCDAQNEIGDQETQWISMDINGYQWVMAFPKLTDQGKVGGCWRQDPWFLCLWLTDIDFVWMTTCTFFVWMLLSMLSIIALLHCSSFVTLREVICKKYNQSFWHSARHGWRQHHLSAVPAMLVFDSCGFLKKDMGYKPSLIETFMGESNNLLRDTSLCTSASQLCSTLATTHASQASAPPPVAAIISALTPNSSTVSPGIFGDRYKDANACNDELMNTCSQLLWPGTFTLQINKSTKRPFALVPRRRNPTFNLFEPFLQFCCLTAGKSLKAQGLCQLKRARLSACAGANPFNSIFSAIQRLSGRHCLPVWTLVEPLTSQVLAAWWDKPIKWLHPQSH